MAVQGGIIERKEIGMGVSLTGEFYNTEVVDGRLQLKKVNESSYYSNGYFISSVIDIGDNFREFDNIISTIESIDESLVIISTRTSDNSLEFTPWEVLDEENKIKSSKKRYIQVRVELSAITESMDNSKKLSEYVTGENEGFLEIDRQGDDELLKLKDEFSYKMIDDESWSEEGDLYRRLVTRDEWLRIDKLNVGKVGN